MSTTLRLSTAAILIVIQSGAARADETPPAAGWYDVIPNLGPLLQPMFGKPEVKETKDGAAYSQSAHYDMATGLQRSFRITVARDPGFKKQLDRDMLKGVAEEQALGKRTLWSYKNGRKVVVPLAADKAVILETDPNSEPMPLVDYAKKLDLDRIAKALDNPPRTDFTPTVDTFKVFTKGGPAALLADWCGPATKYAPLGKPDERRARWTYTLRDKTRVAVLTAGAKIESIVHETADGKVVDLLK